MNERLGFILFYFICFVCFVCFVFMAKTLNAGETFWHADFSSKDYRGTRPHLKLFDRFVLKSIKNEKNKVVGVKDEMLLILAGEFRMGADPKEGYQECKKYSGRCDPKWFYHEAPIHDVHLSSFYMDKY
jgi:formylglycine-generating enzyme required for sulfatase activity